VKIISVVGSDAVGNFVQSVRTEECSNTTFNEPSINVFSCCGRTQETLSLDQLVTVYRT